jgi:hypothetical protein
MTPEKTAALAKMRPTDEQYDAGGTLSHRDWLMQKRARDVERANARAEQLRQQVQDWAAPKLAALPRPAVQGPQMPAIPAPRPDILGPITAEGEAAALKAEAAGQRISAAFNVTATATVNVDDTPIDRTQRKLERLIATAGQARAAVAGASDRVGRVDYDGLHADMTQ